MASNSKKQSAAQCDNEVEECLLDSDYEESLSDSKFT
jgi:hypothetical protein